MESKSMPVIPESASVTPDENSNCYHDATIQVLSNAFVNLYKPDLDKVRGLLNELTTKQTVLVEQLHNENMKLAWSQNSDELQEMFNTVKVYQNKLKDIKKDMKLLHERSTKLRKRSLRLQQHKEKEMYLKNQQVKLEQDLIAKPNSGSGN